MKGLDIAKRILFLVGGIMSAVNAVSFAIASGIFFAFTTPAAKETIIKGLEDGTIHTTIQGMSNEQIATAITNLYLALAIGFVVGMVFAIINMIVSFKARKNGTKKLFILNIVFGAISSVTCNLVAGIFGLITYNRNHQNEEVIDYTEQ